MDPDSIGELELEVWRFVADHPDATVGEVARYFAASRGLARTTLLTVLERLYRKKYLRRRRDGRLFRYSSSGSKAKFLQTLVARFTDRVLGGSLDPFVAYLMSDARLTDAQLSDLRKLVDSMEKKKSQGDKP
jgi:predicted transcriptional regulator